VAKRVSRLVGLASIKKVKVEGSRFAWEQAAAKQAIVARKKAASGKWRITSEEKRERDLTQRPQR